MGKNKGMQLTSFQLPIHLHTQMKTMCVLTRTSMGEFIRISVRDKIKSLKETPIDIMEGKNDYKNSL